MGNVMRNISTTVTGSSSDELANPYRVAADVLFVLAVVGLATWMFAANDPLWLRLNPSPLILMPMLLGGRYGLAVGVLSGGLAAVGGMVSAVAADFGTWNSVMIDHGYTLASLPTVGFVSGRLCAAMRSDLKQEAVARLQQNDEKLRLEAALKVAEESAFRLERNLAVHGVELISLDNELASVLKAENSTFYKDVLGILFRVSGLQEAAIYLPDYGSDQFVRVAALGVREDMPRQIGAEEAIVEEALVACDVVSCRDLWKSTPQQTGKWIGAVPWIDHRGEVVALLMIRRMALLSVSWESLDRIKTVCQWVTCCRLINSDAEPALSRARGEMFQPEEDQDLADLRSQEDAAFERLVETIRLCVRSRDLHGLPTCGVCVEPQDGDEHGEDLPLSLRVGNVLRPQDVCALDPDSGCHLVILPMLDVDGGRKVASEIADLAGVKKTEAYRFAALYANESAEEFLRRLRTGRS